MIAVGNDFVETFENGFDQPGRVVDSAGLHFEDGRVSLGENGFLEYEFDYSTVETNWGLREPVRGQGTVQIIDDISPDSYLKVTLDLQFLHYGPDGLAEPSQLTFEISGTTCQLEILDSPTTDYPFDVTTWSFDRIPGPASLEFLPSDVFAAASPAYRPVDGDEEAPYIHLVESQPMRLRIEGRGFDLDEIRLFTYAVVANESESWGGLKARY